MKNVTSAEIAWLAANPSNYRVDVLEMTLPNGQTLRAALGGADVIWSGATYPATANGAWERGAVESEAMFELGSKSVTLNVVAAAGVNYPGTTVEMASSFINGAWDGATVTLTTLYAPFGQWNNWQVSMVLFGGMVSQLERTGRSKATLTVQDWLYLANLQVPMRIIQPSCFATFGDNRCTFVLSAIGIANTVGAGSTAVEIIPGSAWPAADSRGNSITGSFSGQNYFDNGKIAWASGNNAGFTSHVQSQLTGGDLVLTAPTLFPMATGDAFTAYAGCSKQLSDCKQRWANQANFAGFPFVGVPENAF